MFIFRLRGNNNIIFHHETIGIYMKIEEKACCIIIFVLTTLFTSTSCFSGSVILITELQDTQPKYFIKDGIAEGLCIELIKLVEEKTGYTISYKNEFVPARRIQINLETGATDLHFGFLKSAEREKKYTYASEPLYQVQHLVAVRVDDDVSVKNFDDIRALGENGIILTPFGTGTSRYLQEQGGLLIDDGAEVVESNLRKLLAKRGRFVYYHNLGLLNAIKADEFAGKFKVLPVSFRNYNHYVLFSKKVPLEIIETINNAIIQAKNSGGLAIITDKYTKYPD